MSPAAVLELEQARLRARVGWDAAERARSQAIDLGVRIEFATAPKACATDALGDTICYAELIERAQRRCDEREFHLIEHLAQDLVTALRTLLPPDAALELSVGKPHAPVSALAQGAVFFTLRSEPEERNEQTTEPAEEPHAHSARGEPA